MTGGWKQKSGWIQIFPASGVPFTFPFLFLSQFSIICLSHLLISLMLRTNDVIRVMRIKDKGDIDKFK